MTFRLRCISDSASVATATTATAATPVAKVANVAVAPTAAIEDRRRRVERELAEHPEQRVAVEAVDAPLHAEPGEPVSVVIAVHTAVGIVSGELHVPRERFDAALFFRTLEETLRRPS